MAKRTSPKLPVSLAEKPPRETFGRDTAKRFEYQYRHAAEAALQLLEDQDVKCVYCDFQDDYVVQREVKGASAFDFVQVKTKASEKHEWDLPDVFGINKKKRTPKEKPRSSFAGKLFYHQIAFGSACRSVTILTNVFFVDDISALVQATKAVASYDLLTNDSKAWFDKISDSYCGAFDSIDASLVFAFLKKMELRSNAGPLEDVRLDHSAIFAKRIRDYSEVDITIAEGERIAKSLINLVREKSFPEIPINITEQELRKKAGVTLDDLLTLLTISKSGYEILKSGGDPKAIRSVSRLQRFIGDAGGDQEMVDVACKAKIQWESWLRQNRHIINELDFGTLTSRCTRLAAGRLTMDELNRELTAIEHDFSGKLPTGMALTKDLIFGLLLALTVKESLR